MNRVIAALVALAAFAPLSTGRASQDASRCKSIHADLVEDRATTGCRAPATVCFFGQVDGNQGLRGTTYFNADSVIDGPPTAPEGFIAYSGVFEYNLDDGTIVARETGISNRSVGTPQAGAVTTYQQIVSGTGAFAGVTGHFYVFGRNTDGHIVTEIRGQLCRP
jgi:hypothetical protein